MEDGELQKLHLVEEHCTGFASTIDIRRSPVLYVLAMQRIFRRKFGLLYLSDLISYATYIEQQHYDIFFRRGSRGS